MSTKLTRICLLVICLFVVACASTAVEPSSRSGESHSRDDVVVDSAGDAANAIMEAPSMRPIDPDARADFSDGESDAVEAIEVVEYAEESGADESAEMGEAEAAYDAISSVTYDDSGLADSSGEVAMVRPRPEEPEEPEAETRPEVDMEPEEPLMPRPQAGILTAGDIDDNLNIDSFTEYINNFAQNNRGYPFLTVGERIEVSVVDGDGRPVKHAEVAVVGGLRDVRTAADGKAYIYPELDGITADELQIFVKEQGESAGKVARPGESIQFELESAAASSQEVDLAFIIDTTGSMGDELRYLQVEFESIVQRVQDRFPDADMRFGLTLYRDTGDAYVVLSYPFTGSVYEMQDQLNAQNSDGGGDYEEAVERGLMDSFAQDWRPSATQISFLVADAPPHHNKLDVTWEQAVFARERGIIINTLASSGVDEGTEYMMRSMAALTQGRHLFLTDDSGVGGAHKEPTIPCYVVTPLSDLMVRVISSQILGERMEAVDENIRRTSGQYVNGVCQ